VSTYSDLLTEVREIVQDTATDRFSDALLRRHLNRGIRDMSRIRPDAFWDLYDANSLKVPEVIAAGETPTGTQITEDSEFQFEPQFWTPLVSYVVGSVEMIEDEYTLEGRAERMLAIFRGTLIGV